MLRRLLLQSCGMLAVMTLVTGVAYPLLVTVAAQVAFPRQANGSLVLDERGVVGSELLGQPFADPKYFWGRLSATSPMPYNAGASAGSNLGPTNAAIKRNAERRIEALRRADPNAPALVPSDLVTSSASGLDPHISPEAADFQVERVARARHISEARVRELVLASTSQRWLGVLGEPAVNVLMLNRSLDRAAPR